MTPPQSNLQNQPSSPLPLIVHFVPNINPSAPPPESILTEMKLPAEPTPKISGIEIWHKRLGHLHFDAVKCLANGMAEGISILPDVVTKAICAACMAGKQHIVYGKNKMKRATRPGPLERIHSDASGMLPLGTCDTSSCLSTTSLDTFGYAF